MSLRDDFISSHPIELELRSRGVNLIGEGDERKALCPFHDDHNPSFSVNVNTGLWRCYSCGIGGSVIDLLARFENKSPSDFLKSFRSNGNDSHPPQKFDWNRCVSTVTDDHVEKISKWRGYRPEFVKKLVDEKLIGIHENQVAFPVITDGVVTGVHVRTKSAWLYHPKQKMQPWIIGDHFDTVFIFESQWDALAFMDASRWLELDGMKAVSSIVITRGASNGKSLYGKFSKSKRIVWMQNDKAANGWLDDLLLTMGSLHVARPPSTLKDLNEFHKSGDFASQIIDLTENAVLVEPEKVLEMEVEKTGLPPIVDAFDFVSRPEIKPEELISGLIHKGSKMVVGGGSKSFKTWIQLSMAISVCSGNRWLDRQTSRGRVLFVNFEIQPAFFQDRIIRVAHAMDVKLEPSMMDVWNLRGYAASYVTLIPQIIGRIKNGGYFLVIIDPIYKIYGNGMKDENSASDVAQLMNSLETICTQTGAAIIFGAHHSKGNQSQKESIDRIGGSGVYGRDPDTILDFTHHEEDGCFTVTPILRNLPPIEPFGVRWEFPLMRYDKELDPSKLKQVSGRKRQHDPLQLLEYIKDTTFNNPMSVSEWGGVSNVKRPTLVNYLSEMRLKGWIATAGEGSSARQYITEKGRKMLKYDGNL